MVRKLIQKFGRSVFGPRKKPAEQLPEEPVPEKPLEQDSRQASRGKSRRPGTQHGQNSSQPWSLDAFRVPPQEGSSRFHDFELPTRIMHAVHDLGFKYCTPIQSKVLAHTTAGQNIAGRAQTGTGKTAAFLISIFSGFLKDRKQQEKRKPGTPRALVLAPTRELVLQIVKDAQDLSKYCAFRCMAVYGGMDLEKQRKELTAQPIDLIAATPGRLLDFMQRRTLDLKQLEVLVIDEADRMLDMGFIPDMRRIIRATPPKDKRQTMLFSATLTDDVLRLASQWMPDPVICEMDPEQVTVKTINQVVYMVASRDKFKLLYNLLNREEMKRVLLFGNRRDTTHRLAENLERHGIRCEYLSGAVRQEKRLKIVEDFKKGNIRLVIATDVAGRGLHVDNISHVVNYDFPYEAQDYVHRIGRTARAGLKGTAISFACEEESFVIPEIEKYIGESLTCIMPEPELLAAPPPAGPRSNRHSVQDLQRPRRTEHPKRSGQSERSGRSRRSGSSSKR